MPPPFVLFPLPPLLCYQHLLHRLEPSNWPPLTPSQPLRSILGTSAGGILLNANVLLYPFLRGPLCCSRGRGTQHSQSSHQSQAPSRPATPPALHTSSPALHAHPAALAFPLTSFPSALNIFHLLLPGCFRFTSQGPWHTARSLREACSDSAKPRQSILLYPVRCPRGFSPKLPPRSHCCL